MYRIPNIFQLKNHGRTFFKKNNETGKKNTRAFNPKLKKPELYQKYIIISCKNVMDKKKVYFCPKNLIHYCKYNLHI